MEADCLAGVESDGVESNEKAAATYDAAPEPLHAESTTNSADVDSQCGCSSTETQT